MIFTLYATKKVPKMFKTMAKALTESKFIAAVSQFFGSPEPYDLYKYKRTVMYLVYEPQPDITALDLSILLGMMSSSTDLRIPEEKAHTIPELVRRHFSLKPLIQCSPFPFLEKTAPHQ